MTQRDSQSLSIWIARHSFFVWLGILLNMLFVVALLFKPAWVLAMFNIPPDESIWPRFAALLLFIVSLYYIPPTIDLERYRVNAWLAVFPSRSLGATFFFLAVFVFDQPPGFIVAILLDGLIGLATLWCLIRVTALERSRGLAGDWA
jgi:hypothetical protein